MIITPPAKFLRLAVAGWHPGPLRVNHPEEHRAVGFVNGHDELVGQ
jgi:hypothetical protein